MKTICNYFIGAGIYILALSMISCEKDPKTDYGGEPKLTSITTSTDLNTPISTCNLGDWIVLHGQNLCAARSIVVNGVQLNMREVFLESSKATLQVPRQLAPDGPTNAIEVVSDASSAKLDVEISIPDLIVTGLANEYAPAGEMVNINGANFDLYDITSEKGKVFFGNAQAEIKATTDKYVSVVVPTGAAANDPVRIVGEKIEKQASGRYKDTRGMFESFEGGFGWAGTDHMVTDGTRPGDIKACNGKYLRIARSFGEWDWFPFIANVYTWPEEAFSNPEKYCMKFEIATLLSMSKKYVVFDVTKYEWKPWGTTEFNTYGKWQTVTLEMTDILKGTNNYPGGNFLFQLSINGGVPETLDLCIDNYRLIRKE